MRNLTHNQFVNLHGQRGARLDCDQSIHGTTVNLKTLLVTIVSPFMFWAPNDHFRALDKVMVDGLVHDSSWSEFTNKLNIEWREVTIIVVVLLNVNMAFLSISTVDISGNKVANRSAVQIGSYISTLTSVGSLIMSLLLIRQVKSYPTAVEAASFLGNITYKGRGLEVLAILYAMPYALLIWSVVSFTFAFAYALFFSSSSATRFLAGVVLVIIGGLLVLCIRTGWVHEDQSHLQSLRDDLGDSHKLMVTHDVKAEERETSTDCVMRNSNGDENEVGKRRWSLASMVFIRRPPPESSVLADSDERKTAEV